MIGRIADADLRADMKSADGNLIIDMALQKRFKALLRFIRELTPGMEHVRQ